MVNTRTTIIKKFQKEFKKYDIISVGLIMDRLQISRPTATKIISNLSKENKIKAVVLTGDSTKWYSLK